MKNILLPTDFSENSWNAIKYAINFFEDETCNFYILHINLINKVLMDDSAYVATDDLIEDIFLKPSRKKLRHLLKQIVLEFPKNKNHKFNILTDYNFFIDAIRKTVQDHQIDLIVMGTKGATNYNRIRIGSHTGDVFTKVKCPTLAIPLEARFSKPKTIAFPSDFTLHYNLNLLNPLNDILKKDKALLSIVHISKSAVHLNKDQEKNKALLDDYFNAVPHEFKYLNAKNTEEAIQCFTESRNVDLICMVAKNLNYFQQLLFQSTITSVSYHTKIPFLVLHENTFIKTAI
ncbi:universal stress protein [Formosa sp. S-31]|uniref:universal stress protein n=1 Tax=Formosa sp. S-31 TaxID=2790949 RepID=UPI003EBC2966